MLMRLYRSLYGYNPKWVESQINSLNHQHEKIIEELEGRLSVLIEQVRALESEEQKSKNQLIVLNHDIEEFGKILLQSYLETSKGVFDAMESVKLMEEEKLAQVADDEAKFIMLQKKVLALNENIRGKVRRFMYKLEINECDGVGEADGV